MGRRGGTQLTFCTVGKALKPFSLVHDAIGGVFLSYWAVVLVVLA
jgi:hypothetical protein